MSIKKEQQIYSEIGGLISALCGNISAWNNSNYEIVNGELKIINANSSESNSVWSALNTPSLYIENSGDLLYWGQNVLQWGQPSLQELPSPCILMDFFEGRKVGWESTKYKWNKTTETGFAEISHYREIHFTISFYRDEKSLLSPDFDPIGYNSPLDVANRLRSSFLSDFGISALHNLGYSLKDSSTILNPSLTLDSEVYSRVPNFTLILVTKESINEESDFVDWEQQISNNDTTKSNNHTKLIGI